MAKIIEFYIPRSFRKVSKWLPPNETRQAAGVSSGDPKIRVTARKQLREVELCVMRGDWL